MKFAGRFFSSVYGWPRCAALLKPFGHCQLTQDKAKLSGRDTWSTHTKQWRLTQRPRLSKTWQLANCISAHNILFVPGRKPDDDSQSITWFQTPSRFVWNKRGKIPHPNNEDVLMRRLEQLLKQQRVLHALLKPEQQNYSAACSSTAPKTGGNLVEQGTGIKMQLQRGKVTASQFSKVHVYITV